MTVRIIHICLIIFLSLIYICQTKSVTKDDQISVKPKISGLHELTMKLTKELDLEWTIEVPQNKPYKLEIYFSSLLIALGNRTDFHLLKNVLGSMNDTQLIRNKTTFNIVFYRPDKFEKYIFEEFRYNNFLAILMVEGDDTKYAISTMVHYYEPSCLECGKLHTTNFAVAGIVAIVMGCVTVCFMLWIIREKVFKALGCKQFIRDPYKARGFDLPKPVPMIIVPRFDLMFTSDKLEYNKPPIGEQKSSNDGDKGLSSEVKIELEKINLQEGIGPCSEGKIASSEVNIELEQCNLEEGIGPCSEGKVLDKTGGEEEKMNNNEMIAEDNKSIELMNSIDHNDEDLSQESELEIKSSTTMIPGVDIQSFDESERKQKTVTFDAGCLLSSMVSM